MTDDPTDDVTRRLVLALDVDDLDDALRLACDLRPYFGLAKVGLELFTTAGPAAVSAMRELGYDVFADLKLHDIPTTVERAARVVGRLGARHLTVHTAGGSDMLRAGNEGFLTGASEAGTADPSILAVTVLTSDGPAAAELVPERTRTAVDAGCGGVVCAVAEAPTVRDLGPDLVILTPGIRPAGTPTHDQARAATPEAAIRAGSDLLVIGRAVTQADDPIAAAASLVADVGSVRPS